MIKEYLTKEQTDKLFNVITVNGCGEMEETRFHQAVNEAIYTETYHSSKKQITDLLNTNKIEVGLQKYLEDNQVYNNYRRSFMLPDDSEIVAGYVGIYIRKLLVDIKSELTK